MWRWIFLSDINISNLALFTLSYLCLYAICVHQSYPVRFLHTIPENLNTLWKWCPYGNDFNWFRNIWSLHMMTIQNRSRLRCTCSSCSLTWCRKLSYVSYTVAFWQELFDCGKIIKRWSFFFTMTWKVLISLKIKQKEYILYRSALKITQALDVLNRYTDNSILVCLQEDNFFSLYIFKMSRAYDFFSGAWQ